MNDGFDLFLICIKDLNDPQKVNEANEQLESLMQDDTALYLTYAAQVIINFCERKENQEILESENDVIVSLSAIKSVCTPKRATPIESIQQYWTSDDQTTNEMRPLVKESILLGFNNQSIPIRRMACAALAAYLLIETKKFTEIIKTVLISTSETDPLNFGAIMTFLELFDLKVIPLQIRINRIGENCFSMLLEIIFNLLTCSNPELVNQAFKIDASICLRKLIANGDESLFQPDLINRILDIICYVFQNEADLTADLYRELHFVMLEIIKSLYSNSEVFCDKIYSITDIGINSESPSFKIISYNFWSMVWNFEKEFQPSQPNQPYLNIVGQYSDQLINYGIELISEIDPADTYLMNDSECKSIDYIWKTLGQLFDNLANSFQLTDESFESLTNMIDEFLSADENSNADSYHFQHYTAILLMRALILEKKKDKTIYEYIGTKIPEITEFAVSDVENLSDISLQLLTELIKSYDHILSYTGYAKNIFSAIQTCSRFTNYTVKFAINLSFTFCSHIQSMLLDDTNFDILYEIFEEKFTDVSFLQSNIVFNLQKAFAKFIERSGSKSNIKLIDILNKCIEILNQNIFTYNYGFVSPIAFSLTGWNTDVKYDTDEDSSFYYFKDRTFLLRITLIIIRKFYKLELDIMEQIDDVLEILFKILQNQSSFLFDECLRAVSDIVDLLRYKFEPYKLNYIPVISNCLFSQDPELIKTSALCFGELCKNLGYIIGDDVRDLVIDMFTLMTSFDEFQQMAVIDIFFVAFAKIVLGLKDYLLKEFDFIIELFNFVTSMINFRIDIENKNEYEFGEKLYISICLVCSAIIQILPEDVFDDMSFFNALREKLNNLFKNIESFHTKNTDMVWATMGLLKVLRNTKNIQKINVVFHKHYYVKLKNWFNFGISNLFTQNESNFISNLFTNLDNL